MKAKVFILGLLFAVFCTVSLSYAEGIPQVINYQGSLVRSQGGLIDSTVSMTFTIYTDSTGDSSLWSETQSVDVKYGVFSVLLGAVNPLPDTIFTGDVRYLAVKVGDDQEMSPRKEIVSVAYALHAKTADQLSQKATDWDYETYPPHMFSIPTGNVGIGTENPDYRLVVEDQGNGGIKIHRPGTGAGLRFNMVNDGRNWQLYHAGGPFSIEDVTAGEKRLTIDINGNVGIGTTDPGDYKLYVDGKVRARFVDFNAGLCSDGSGAWASYWSDAGPSSWSGHLAGGPVFAGFMVHTVVLHHQAPKAGQATSTAIPTSVANSASGRRVHSINWM